MLCVLRNTRMAKVTKSFRIPHEVAVELEQEENQSAKVVELLREEYDL